MQKIWRYLRLAVLGAALVSGASSVVLAQAMTPTPDATFENVKILADDFVMGRADAPVTIVEYASLTCSHCATFHAKVLPKLKKDYIESGKVRLVYRDFPLDRSALAASMLARCNGRDRFFGFLDILFRDQNRWARSNNPMRALGQIARLGGLTPTKFAACLKDEKLQTAILQQRLGGANQYKINATPTLIINGHKYGGGLTFEQIKAVVDPMLSKS